MGGRKRAWNHGVKNQASICLLSPIFGSGHGVIVVIGSITYNVFPCPETHPGFGIGGGGEVLSSR